MLYPGNQPLFIQAMRFQNVSIIVQDIFLGLKARSRETFACFSLLGSIVSDMSRKGFGVLQPPRLRFPP